MRHLLWLLLLVSCATSSTGSRSGGPALDDHAPAMAGAGPRCASAPCSCRIVDDYGRAPREQERNLAAGSKRFEFRTGRGLDPVTVVVEKLGSLHKATETPEPSCAYADLTPGRYRVRFHATAANPDAGMVPSLFIHEYGARTQDWYGTFEFRCGGDEPCSIGDMEQWMAGEQKVARGIHDPCGSVRVFGVRYTADRAVGVKLADLVLELTLEVYKFPPRFPRGTAHCKGLDPQTRAEEEAEKQ